MSARLLERRVVTDRAYRSNPVWDYFRCPSEIPDIAVAGNVGKASGFFRFGEGITCYGRAHGNIRATADHNLFDVSKQVQCRQGAIFLPFDAAEVVDNSRYERYVNPSAGQRWVEKSWASNLYYRLRPALPVSLRKQLQRVYLRGWESIPFPNWPVDCTVERLHERLLVLTMQALQTDKLPFIWFWPEGHQACAILTHDVETRVGRDFSATVMDIDDAFGIPASFQLVPEKRYEVRPEYLETIRSRGFEINVQGLDHDGNLFQDRKAFLEAAEKINRYGRQFGSLGFRSPVLYRNIDWLQDLHFAYDMSVPNVARLEAQRGGCCTVMPYFLPGGVTELPLTTTEDYTLFQILKDYSISLWKQQMSLILERHGLISLLVHPDYVTTGPAQKVYKELLSEVARLRSEQGVWVTLPREVDRWWRERSEMRLVADGNHWRIEGDGSERARIAYACLDGDRLRYEVASSAERSATGCVSDPLPPAAALPLRKGETGEHGLTRL